jgi:amidase
VRADELVEAAVARIDALDPSLNAVIHRRFERALAEAAEVDPPTQPFAGVPLLLKDASAQQAGEPHHQGMAVLRDAEFRESQDSWLVERFRAAGFVVVGRTNTPELCAMPTTEPTAYGASRNPWSLEHSTGGSSGGSAAAVAAGLTPVAHASDGGGSIRMPASCCGLVGLKPSRARITRGPLEGEGWGGLSTEGVLTHTVRDTAAVLDCIVGPGVGDPSFAPPLVGSLREAAAHPFVGPRLRIGVRTDAFAGGDPTHPDCVAAVVRSCTTLEDLGHTLVDDGPPIDDEHVAAAQGLIVGVSLAASLEAWGHRLGREIALEELERINAITIEAARSRSAVEHAMAQRELHAYSRRVVGWWEEHDLLLTPTLTDPPPRLGEIRGDLSPEDGLALRRRFGWLTPPWNITGQPAISVPVGQSAAGLPIGVQLVAAPGREDVLVRVAAQLESVLGLEERRAPHHA